MCSCSCKHSSENLNDLCWFILTILEYSRKIKKEGRMLLIHYMLSIRHKLRIPNVLMINATKLWEILRWFIMPSFLKGVYYHVRCPYVAVFCKEQLKSSSRKISPYQIIKMCRMQNYAYMIYSAFQQLTFIKHCKEVT